MVDEGHIYPTAGHILRRKRISLEENSISINVYTHKPVVLPTSILDECSIDVGKYLLVRYMARERLFNITEKDIPSNTDINAQHELISSAKRNKGVTLRRTLKSKVQPVKTGKEIKEKIVEKEIKVIDSISSENNAWQALVKSVCRFQVQNWKHQVWQGISADCRNVSQQYYPSFPHDLKDNSAREVFIHTRWPEGQH